MRVSTNSDKHFNLRLGLKEFWVFSATVAAVMAGIMIWTIPGHSLQNGHDVITFTYAARMGTTAGLIIVWALLGIIAPYAN